MRAIALIAGLLLAFASAAADLQDGARLRERFQELQPELQHNAFGRPIHLDSQERAQVMRGDVHAVLDHPYA